MSLLIADEMLSASSYTEDELRVEIAVMLFAQERLSIGRAAELSGMNRIDFQLLLGARQIPAHYDIEQFESDLETLRQLEGLFDCRQQHITAPESCPD